jgi:hypothetical protein
MSHSDHAIWQMRFHHRPLMVRAMRIDRSFVGWGLFFIVVGAIPLAVRSGALTADQVLDWWRFWPLILVGVGLAIILRRTPLEALGGWLVAITSGAMLGSLLATGLVGIGGFSADFCGHAERAVSFPSQSGAFFDRATVELDLDCGDVSVSTQAGTNWSVEGEDRTPGGPEIQVGERSLAVRSSEGVRGPFDLIGRHTAWRVGLPTEPRLDVDAKVSAGSATFDLDGADLDAMALELNAGSATVDLGQAHAVGQILMKVNAGSLALTLPATSTFGSIQLNAGSVDLCTQPGVALRLKTNESLVTSFDYEDQGLIHNGDVWVSPDFDTAAQRIDLVTDGNAGSFELNPEEGCRD